MFSNFGPLFKTVFRQAESMDTRQAIRREDKKVKRQGQEFEEETGSPIDIWEDDTRVSVESLRTFLINFVQSQHKEESTETAIHSS